LKKYLQNLKKEQDSYVSTISWFILTELFVCVYVNLINNILKTKNPVE
jgi:hypothetical protein